jgi:hypothetical protein
MRVWSYATNGGMVATDSLYWLGSFSAYVGNSAWISWVNHAYQRYQVGQPSQLLAYVEGNRATLSPRGDRLAPVDGWVDPALGVPVFDVAGAPVAFHLPGAAAMGSDFSAGGDTLFMALGAGHGIGGTRIVAADASTGAIFSSSDSLGAEDFEGLLADPSAPWLYYMRPAEVTVLDRRTMKVVARLGYQRVPPNLNTWYYMFLDATARRLYVYETRNGTVYEFSLLP